MQITSSVDALAGRREGRLPNGGVMYKSVFVGPWEKPATMDPNLAQAYIVDQDPGTRVEPHYHEVEQFQVVVQGEGLLGKHAVKPVALHYTDPYTAYGPIIPNDGSRIAYFTMRAKSDVRARFLHEPDARAAMKPSRRRFLLLGPDKVGLSDAAALKARSGVAVDKLIEMHDDGVTAEVVRLGPGAKATCLDPKTGGGHYVLVVNGALVREGSALPYCSCAFVRPDNPALEVEAGPEGAELLVMQYPRFAA
jgi:hypothetical protein